MRLQTIGLNEIKGLDKRVRQQMNPEKLEELSDSLKESGQLVPIKVRQNGTGYVLVYGHRRVMAAKAAGQKTIEALVADVPDDKLLTQSLIENVIREDMAAIDIAKALRTIKDETGATDETIGKKMGWARSTVTNYMAMLEPELGLTGRRSPANIDKDHVTEAKTGTGGDLKLAAQVLRKVSDEDLSRRETRKYAEVIRHASDIGGSKAVARVMAQPTAQVLAAAPTTPVRHVKPVVREVRGEVYFQWMKAPQVMLAETGIEHVVNVIREIDNSQKDRGGGTAALKRLNRLLADAQKRCEKAIERR